VDKGKKRRGIAHRDGQVWIRGHGGHADLRLVLHEGATPACRRREWGRMGRPFFALGGGGGAAFPLSRQGRDDRLQGGLYGDGKRSAQGDARRREDRHQMGRDGRLRLARGAQRL